MKQSKALLLTIVALLFSISVKAEIVKIGDLWYDIVKKINKVEVIERQDPGFDELWMIPIYYEGNTIVIPDSVEYNGEYLKVTSIGDYAFHDCYFLSKIVVPKTVKRIGSYAFYTTEIPGFWGVGPEVVLSEGVETIGDNAFWGCLSLSSLNIPNTVKSIGNYAFAYSGLNSIEIPNSVTDTVAIGWFEECENLESVKLSNSLVEIDDLFYSCTNLNYVEMPNSIKQIGYSTFYGCSSLSELKMPNNLQSIGDNAFANCSSLTGLIFPASLQSIGDNAFANCSSLTGLIFPANLQSIGDNAFANCVNLKTIKLPESLLEIGNETFINCSSIDSIFIPKNIVSIGRTPFMNCSAVRSIIVEEGNSNYDSRDGCNAIIESSTNTLLTGCNYTTLPNSITGIGMCAFMGCQEIISVVIPNSVTIIESNAFYKCTHLAHITISSGIKEIGDYAFAYCDDLQNVYCNARSVPQTAEYAFRDSYIEYATLYVNQSSLNDYKSISPWSRFGTIVVNENSAPAFNLIYMIDDEEYIRYELEEGDLTIIPVEPKKDGYTFDGWSDIPEFMPAHDVIVTGTFTFIISDKPEELTLTLNQYGKSTYCSEYALDFTNVEGLKAYVATGYNTRTGVVTMTRVMTTKGGTGLFLKGTQGSYQVPIIAESDDNTLNLLVGTLSQVTVNSKDDTYTNYKFTVKAGETEPSFYNFADNSTLSANKAYLHIPTAWLSSTSAAKSVRMWFEDEEPTGIDEINTNRPDSDTIYDMQGRCVKTPGKGIYIVNGKKMIIK